MSLFRRRATNPTRTSAPRDRETALAMYLAGNGNPTPGAIALMLEVDRGRERQADEARQAAERDANLNLPRPPKPTGDPIRDAIAAADHKATVNRMRWDAEQAQREAETAASEAQREQFLTACRLATPDDYAPWLTGYLKAGGYIGTVGGSSTGMLVLTRRPDRKVPTLYGSMRLDVIVPADVDFTPDDLPRTFRGACGHSTFFFMDGFEVVGGPVPLPSDVRPLLDARTPEETP